jgi:hypothetical protein
MFLTTRWSASNTGNEVRNMPILTKFRVGNSQRLRLLSEPSSTTIYVLEGEAMPSSKHLKFAHRFNPDGTVDSICPRCFVTVDSAAKELDLVVNEEQHICDPFLVARYEFFGRKLRSETSQRVRLDRKRPS